MHPMIEDLEWGVTSRLMGGSFATVLISLDAAVSRATRARVDTIDFVALADYVLRAPRVAGQPPLDIRRVPGLHEFLGIC
jgi:hypothetical protein